ncbi:MAG: fructose-bisphosphatase class III, partial [Lachnospiraceae bacterium]|nr:fructose-bisphosphatase class III [Lachnospiraceae bacterium]
VIDGGFSKAYHKTTGLAGYTLVANSHGVRIVAHELFESMESAIRNETDILSDYMYVENYPKRQLVADTDNGEQLKEEIRQLEDLLQAYREGILIEKS